MIAPISTRRCKSLGIAAPMHEAAVPKPPLRRHSHPCRACEETGHCQAECSATRRTRRTHRQVLRVGGWGLRTAQAAFANPNKPPEPLQEIMVPSSRFTRLRCARGGAESFFVNPCPRTVPVELRSIYRISSIGQCGVNGGGGRCRGSLGKGRFWGIGGRVPHTAARLEPPWHGGAYEHTRAGAIGHRRSHA